MMACGRKQSKISRKHLEIELYKIRNFAKPVIGWEQYMTPPGLAAEILVQIEHDIDGCIVADLGCGTGMLSIGCALVGADFVLGLEIDSEATLVAADNVANSNLQGKVDLVTCDIKSAGMGALCKRFDTVFMNPPFGTKTGVKDIRIRRHRQKHKQKGTAAVVYSSDVCQATDIDFLKVSCMIARKCVYSLHKSETIRYIETICKEWGVKAETVGNIPQYNLTASYKHESKQSKNIDVSLLRLSDLGQIKEI